MLPSSPKLVITELKSNGQLCYSMVERTAITALQLNDVLHATQAQEKRPASRPARFERWSIASD
jgi:hypothetical protein